MPTIYWKSEIHKNFKFGGERRHVRLELLCSKHDVKRSNIKGQDHSELKCKSRQSLREKWIELSNQEPKIDPWPIIGPHCTPGAIGVDFRKFQLLQAPIPSISISSLHSPLLPFPFLPFPSVPPSSLFPLLLCSLLSLGVGVGPSKSS